MSYSLIDTQTSLDDWVMIQDPNSGKMYYANIKTKETRWTLPPPPPLDTALFEETENNSESDSDNDVLDSDYITLFSPITDEQKMSQIYSDIIDENEDEASDMDLSNETDSDNDIMNQLLQFGYNEHKIVSALEMVQRKHLIYDINHVLEQITSNEQKFYIEEFIVTFEMRPFGMELTTKTSDKSNLYVRKVAPNSIAQRGHVMAGSQVIALNGENIEGIGATNIFRHMKQAKLPLNVMFRNKRKDVVWCFDNFK